MLKSREPLVSIRPGIAKRRDHAFIRPANCALACAVIHDGEAAQAAATDEPSVTESIDQLRGPAQREQIKGGVAAGPKPGASSTAVSERTVRSATDPGGVRAQASEANHRTRIPIASSK